MSDGRRFIGGAAVGLFLAVAIVTAISLGTASVGPDTQSIAVKSVTVSSATATSEAVPSSAGVQANLHANSTTSTTTYLSSPPSQSAIQADNATKGASTGATLSLASLLQTLPAVAIALVLGIVVYQFSIRRVETD